MSLLSEWDSIKREFIRDGIKVLYSDWGDFSSWRKPFEARIELHVGGCWNGAVLNVSLAHSHDRSEWFPIDDGNFEPVSGDNRLKKIVVLPNEYFRIEYWLEGGDRLTDIEFFVEVAPLENPIGKYEGRDTLEDTIIYFELFAHGEGIPAKKSFMDRREDELQELVAKNPNPE